jgi:hypothetical protein
MSDPTTAEAHGIGHHESTRTRATRADEAHCRAAHDTALGSEQLGLTVRRSSACTPRTRLAVPKAWCRASEAHRVTDDFRLSCASWRSGSCVVSMPTLGPLAWPVATNDSTEVIGAALIAARLDHLEQPARAQSSILLQLLDDERQKWIRHRRSWCHRGLRGGRSTGSRFRYPTHRGDGGRAHPDAGSGATPSVNDWWPRAAARRRDCREVHPSANIRRQ